MASYHMAIKSHGKGKAADRSKYITRQGKYNDRIEDLVATGHGNLPEAANGNPYSLWRNADKYERANGSACREFELALPGELTLEQQKEVLHQFINDIVGDKPYEYAIHRPSGAISGTSNPHAHVLLSDRVSDGIDRTLDQMFRRYNPHYPARGGCRKDSGGKPAHIVREELIATRERWADIQNEALKKHGHTARVDHRTLAQQGISRAPEHHLGPARVRNMSSTDKERYVTAREKR
ncbi:MobA/MobL family protein [Burkholderia paludis]|uniref:MobA/MobL family protein n=1 Tax=Burkholderia paludis TaxID=1506587 RepID=UPI000946E33E|nr:MobA/MobL family protein [Burkholderia paludis]